MPKKKPRGPSVRVTGVCELFATFAMACPLCGVTVPPNTTHTCKRLEAK